MTSGNLQSFNSTIAKSFGRISAICNKGLSEVWLKDKEVLFNYGGHSVYSLNKRYRDYEDYYSALNLFLEPNPPYVNKMARSKQYTMILCDEVL